MGLFKLLMTIICLQEYLEDTHRKKEMPTRMVSRRLVGIALEVKLRNHGTNITTCRSSKRTYVLRHLSLFMAIHDGLVINVVSCLKLCRCQGTYSETYVAKM